LSHFSERGPFLPGAQMKIGGFFCSHRPSLTADLLATCFVKTGTPNTIFLNQSNTPPFPTLYSALLTVSLSLSSSRAARKRENQVPSKENSFSHPHKKQECPFIVSGGDGVGELTFTSRKVEGLPSLSSLFPSRLSGLIGLFSEGHKTLLRSPLFFSSFWLWRRCFFPSAFVVFLLRFLSFLSPCSILSSGVPLVSLLPHSGKGETPNGPRRGFEIFWSTRSCRKKLPYFFSFS